MRSSGAVRSKRTERGATLAERCAASTEPSSSIAGRCRPSDRPRRLVSNSTLAIPVARPPQR